MVYLCQFDLDIPHTLVSLTLPNGKNMRHVQVETVLDQVELQSELLKRSTIGG